MSELRICILETTNVYIFRIVMKFFFANVNENISYM